MNSLDWTIVVVYLILLIWMSYGLGKNYRNREDYYLGSSKMHWFPVGISTMATQLSTNSMLGAPAFVAFSAGGGLLWLQYELAVPLAMIVIMVFLVPFFRRAKVISIYEYLEIRLGPKSRTALSIIFQFFVAFGTGVTIYGISLVLQTVLDIPFAVAVIVLGVVTVIYDTLGGMKSVIFSDVLQMAILMIGIAVTGYYAVQLTGGVDAVLANFSAERMQALDFSGHGFGDNKTFTFLPMLFGGLFLYVSYYGCNQTQAQRQLTTKNTDHANLSLFLNGVLRFPIVLAYSLLGVAIGAFAVAHTGFLATLPTREVVTDGVIQHLPNFNAAVPVFVLDYLPNGIIGLIFVALFAAAMSSLDSTLNSLSATTSKDILGRYFAFYQRLDNRGHLRTSKVLTLFWGVVCISFSFMVGNISDSIIVSINKIGSLANGPTLAAFLLAITTRRANDNGVVIGIAGGLLFNLVLWLFFPGVSWLWWNATGAIVTFILGILASYAFAAPATETLKKYTWIDRSRYVQEGEKSAYNWPLLYGLLLAWFGLMVVFLALI
jgi:SSS family transporter